MQSRVHCIVLFVAFVVMLISVGLSAQEPAATEADEKAAWAVYEKAAIPGEFHKLLDVFVGKWNVKSKFWHRPGDNPETSSAVAVDEWTLGGRFIRESYESTSEDYPYAGIGLTGYDNVKRKFISIWADTMGTGIASSAGVVDKAGKVFTFTGTTSDPITKGVRSYRIVSTVIDKDNHRMEMFDKAPDGREFKSIELRYSRVK